MTTQSDIAVDHRRRLVARLLARRGLERLGLAGIAQALADPDLPEHERSTAPNGEPWSTPTISRDIAHIRQTWREEATSSVVELRAKQLAVLDELLMTALVKTNDLGWAGEARQLIAQQAKLLGTDSDQTRILAHVQMQMSLAFDRLQAQFRTRPELLKEILGALIANPEIMPTVPPPQIEA